jgi:ABC-type glycerol-3-phosphate transport system substrate-binding protein
MKNMITTCRRGAALLALLLMLSACAGIAPAAQPDAATAGPTNVAPTQSDADATAAPGTEGAVTIGFAAPEFERAAYEPLIAAFNQQNPDVHVEFVPIGMQQTQSLDQLVRQIVSSADTAATFFLRSTDIKNGLVRDLAPLIDADPSFDRADYYTGALAADADGGIYLLPHTLQLELLSYNKDLWARRGLPAPKPDWSWSDLLAAAEQLAQKRGDTVDVYGLADGSGGQAVLGGLLTEAGVDGSTAVEQLRLDQPAISQALERVADLAKSGAIYVNSDSGAQSGPDTFLKLIADQQVAMWFGAPMMIGPDVPKPAFAVGTAALPTSRSAGGDAAGYIMSAGSAHPEVAWRWLSFLSHQEVRQPFMAADSVGSVPARKSLAERSGYWKQLDPDTAAVAQAVLERDASPVAREPADRRAIAALGQALTAVVGGQPVAQALTEAQATLDKQIAEAQSNPTATPDAGPVVVATPAPSGPAPGATAITFNVALFQAEQFRRLAAEFNQQHPELFVQVKTNQLDRDMTLAKMAEGADCFSWPDPAAASAITSTLDLQPLADADPSFKLDDYPAALLAQFQRGTALLGLPYQVRLRALTYNQSAFDAAGLSHPAARWTADDFLNAAKQLTSGEGGDKRYGYAALATQTDDLLLFMGLFDAQVTRGEDPNFVDPKVGQAVRFYLDLLRNYSPHEQIQGYTRNQALGGETFQLIDEGRVGMWLDLPGGMQIVIVGPDGGRRNYTRAIAPLPGAGAVAAASFDTSGLYISAQAQHPEVCWQWLKFLNDDVSALGGDFPARRSLAESDVFLKQAPSGAAEVYAAYRPALDRAPAASGQDSGSNRPQLDLFWFFRAVDRALQGKDLDRELADAQAKTEQYLTCVRGGGELEMCAKQTDPTYEGFAGSGRGN